MKHVVTGGCGFIGSHLVDRLVELGHEVVVVDDLSANEGRSVNPGATLIEGSVTDLELVTSATNGRGLCVPYGGLGAGAEIDRRSCRDA